ncbi:MAG: hypothetical protein GC206_13545 [Alphaproteobacteria bacterium]|nr:hypothetical protein [Alphaproteobacteria bacterium]
MARTSKPTEPQKPAARKSSLAGMLAPLILATAIGGGGAWWLLGRTPADDQKLASSPSNDCITDSGTMDGGPLDLVDSGGAPTTQARFAGRPALLYFGFTRCPDICPMALDLMAQGMHEMGAQADQLQPVFISVDPARDTPEEVASYISTERFPPRLVGLTGSNEQVDAASRAFGVGAMRSGDPASPDYVVQHASFIYIMDGAWTLRGMIRSNEATPESLVQCIRTSLGEDLRPAL